jgi:hypothetical protein
LPHLFVVCCIALSATTGLVSAQEISKIPPPRNESLELPGLTAGCHICEWRPKLNQMPAAAQCGSDTSGASKVGLFECGFSEDCQRECHFLRCGTD